MKTPLALLLVGPVCGLAMAQNPDAFMGDWQGEIKLGDAAPTSVSIHVIARGDGRYETKVVRAFNERSPWLHQLRGRIVDGRLSLLDAIPFEPARVLRAAEDGVVIDASWWTGIVGGDGAKGAIKGRLNGAFELRQTQRHSPTLGQEPPPGAVVLFDGRNLDAWRKVDAAPAPAPAPWQMMEGDAMEVKGGDIVTKRQFRDHQLHLEFKLPYMPHATGQGRANSGVYLQGRYELQVLDSYGLEGEDNECGGIYQVARPQVNMCFPPLQWQTYDITFKAPRFEDGKKVANARITVIHNGVVIHDDIQLPKPTGGAIDPNEAAPGGIKLQDHGNPVQFRNIWVVEQ